MANTETHTHTNTVRKRKIEREEMSVQETEQQSSENVDYFNRIPEECLIDTVSHTTPVDVCTLTLVAPSLRSLADSDAVWERFLPSDYEQLMARVMKHIDQPLPPRRARAFKLKPRLNPEIPVFTSKKEMFRFLCDHALVIDNGAMTFSMDKLSGKKCFMISASTLAIVWGDTPFYWRWILDPVSRFGKVVQLVDVCWLEISGKISTSMLSPYTTYGAYLVYKPSKVYGFKTQPVEISVGINGAKRENRKVYIDPQGGVENMIFNTPRRLVTFDHFGQRGSKIEERIPGCQYQDPTIRKDGWLELELGEYFNHESKGEELEVTLMEVEGGKWKSGLYIEGIEFRPKV